MFQLPRRARSQTPRRFQNNAQKTHMVFSLCTSVCIIGYIFIGAGIGVIHTSTHTNARDNAIALLMDTSLSMSAKDVLPNRYDHMLAIVSGLVARYPAEYVGIPFGAMPILRTPRSHDTFGIHTVLSDDTLGSYHLALEYMGSAPGNAVGFAMQELKKTHASHRTIVLLGDGNINTGYNRETFLPLLRTQEITLLVCSIGKPGYVLGTRFDDSPVLSEGETKPLAPFLAGIAGQQHICNNIPDALNFLGSYLDHQKSTNIPTITRERWYRIWDNPTTRTIILLCIAYQCAIAIYSLMVYRRTSPSHK